MIALIVNPEAGRGRAHARAGEAAGALSRVAEVRRYETRAAGDERRCAREAVAHGASIVAVVGGDGSVHHTVRGLLDMPSGAPTVPLAIYAAGTGNDFVKSLGTPSHDYAALTALVAGGVTHAVDVGEIDGVPFVNAAGLGFDVEVLDRMQHARRLRGPAAYVLTALRALFGYRGYDAQWGDARGTPDAARHLLTVFANGTTFGGTFRIAPHALLDDGVLELVDIAALSPLARPAVFLRALRGSHIGHPGVTHQRGTTWTIRSAQPLAFEADGERYTARSNALTVRVIPRALTVIAGTRDRSRCTSSRRPTH